MPPDHSTDAERPPTGLRAYREVLRVPGARALTLASVVARLPNGMTGIALTLFLHEETGSFASAGLVTGAFVIGLGVTGPLLARLIDRFGSHLVLIGGGLLAGLALALVVVLGRAGASPGVIAAVTLLAGAASPPLGSVFRRRWSAMVPTERLPTAYAMDAMILEAGFIVGPALAGLLTATLSGGDAVLFAAIVSAAGSLWASRLVHFPPRPPEEVKERHWAGALRSPVVRLLIATGLPMGAGIGGLELALPAFGAAHGNAALGGVFYTGLALGSLLGGLAYGARANTFGSPQRGLVTLGAAQGLACVPMLFVGLEAEMIFAAMLAGFFWAPLNTVRTRLLQALVEGHDVVEAFTWDGLSETVGASVSIALVGSLIAAHGWRSGVVVACALPLIGGLIAFLNRAVVAPGPRDPAPTPLPELPS